MSISSLTSASTSPLEWWLQNATTNAALGQSSATSALSNTSTGSATNNASLTSLGSSANSQAASSVSGQSNTSTAHHHHHHGHKQAQGSSSDDSTTSSDTTNELDPFSAIAAQTDVLQQLGQLPSSS